MATAADNWVERQGGLPPYIKRIVRHLRAKGMTEGHAIAVAVNACRRMCATGDANFPGIQNVNAGSRSEACAAIARWEAMKAAANGRPDAPDAAVRPSAPPREPAERPSKPTPRREPPERPAPRAVTRRAWDGSPSRFTDAQYRRSCVLDRGGDAPVKQRYGLPIREPDGTLNMNAVRAAAAVIPKVDAPSKAVRAAARKLIAAYRELGLAPPKALLALAGLAAQREGRDMPDALYEERTVDVDVSDLEQRGRTVVGYAALYNVLSHDLGGFRERIAPGAFADVLASNPDVRALLNHSPNDVLGRTRSGTLRLSDDEQRGLRFELDLPDSPLGQNVREAVRRGDIDGASFRFRVAPDGEAWEGETRTLTRIAELRDCSLATFSAYPDASIELRTRPDETPPAGEEERSMDEERRDNGGGLRVEDRAERGNEARSLIDRFRRAGWTPSESAAITWDEFLRSDEQRALTWTGDIATLGPVRREGVSLGFDRRYAWPVFPSSGVDAGTTSVHTVRQTARTLPSPADVIRAINATTPKPEAGSTVVVEPLVMKQVAAVQTGIPNVFLEHDQVRTIVNQDLRLSINEALDKLVLDALATAGFQAPGTDPLLVSIRKAMTLILAAGYNPDTLILTPANAEALDVLRTSGPEAQYVFGAGRFAPGELFGLNVRMSKSAPAPIVADSSAFGRLYASPISLRTFEENDGRTNTSLVRMEGHAVFGVERLDAARRIAAA